MNPNGLVGRLDKSTNDTGVGALNAATTQQSHSAPSFLEGITADSSQYKSVKTSIDRQSFEASAATGDDEAFLKEIEKLSGYRAELASKKFLDRERQMSTIWLVVVNEKHGKVSKVLGADMFQPKYLKIAKPTKGYTTIRSSTLEAAFAMILALICRYCLDPTTGKRMGYTLLTEEGMYIEFKRLLMALIFNCNLERNPRTKLNYGREHMHMILARMFRDSQSSGLVRISVIQNAVRFLLTFYTTCRPSTGGPTEPKWAKAGMYPKLEDVTVYRKAGIMHYEIHLRLRVFKGSINTVNASQQFVILHPVKHSHNAFLDITLWFMALLFGRKAFITKYATLEQLFMDESAQLEIDPTLREEPLFREIAGGGRGFTTRKAPSTADAVSRAFGDACVKAGLPRQGVYCLRREGGNMYGHQLGRDIAKVLMNHRSSMQIFEQFYESGVKDIPLVSIRLGEIAGPHEKEAGEALKHNYNQHFYHGVVVESLLRYKGKTIKTIKEKKRAERRPEVLNDKTVLEIQDNIKILSDEYLTCFNYGAYRIDTTSRRNIEYIFNVASGSQSASRDISFREGMKEQAIKLREELSAIFATLQSTTRALNKKAAVKDAQEMTRSFLNDPISGTVKERTDMLDHAAEMEKELVADLVRKDKGLDVEANSQDDDEDDSEVNEDDDDDDFEEIATEEMLEEYRKERQAGELDPCKFSPDKDIHEWSKNMGLEIQLERMQDDEDSAIDTGSIRVFNSVGEKELEPPPGVKSGHAPEVAPPPPSVSPSMPPLRDLDESLETDVLNIDVGEVRKSVFTQIIAPVLFQESKEVVNESGVKTFPCELCEARGKHFVSTQLSSYVRHQKQSHSEWKELSQQMTIPGQDGFYCPSGCPKEFSTEKKVFFHMIGVDKQGEFKCTDGEKYSDIKAMHDNGYTKYQNKNRLTETSLGLIPADDEHLVEARGLMEFALEDEVTSDVSYSDSAGPSRLMDWASLTNAELHGLDFEDLMTKPVPLDEKVHIHRPF